MVPEEAVLLCGDNGNAHFHGERVSTSASPTALEMTWDGGNGHHLSNKRCTLTKDD